MSNCKNQIGLKDLGLEEILKLLITLLIPAMVLPKVPTTLIAAGVPQRGGLSPTRIWARVENRVGEAGGHMGVHEDGSPNLMAETHKIVIEEMVNAIQTEMKIEGVTLPGQLVTGTFVGLGSGSVVAYTVTEGSNYSLAT